MTIIDDIYITYKKLLNLRNDIVDTGEKIYDRWEADITNDSFRPSAYNLAMYVALRQFDVYNIQIELMNLGYSSLDHIEDNVLGNIDQILFNMSLIVDNDRTNEYKHKADITYGEEKLEKNIKKIFGRTATKSTGRVMVTMPPEASEDVSLLKDMLDAGMTMARINCAHDSAEVWEMMVDNLHEAMEDTGKSCKIYLDIPGPKIRINGIYTTLQRPKVKAGDQFFITSQEALKSMYNIKLVVQAPLLAIVQDLAVGNPVLLDDGEIIGEITAIKEEGVIVKVLKTFKSKGSRIRATKGLNFPENQLEVSVITETDLEYMHFAQDKADIVGFSFLRETKDVTAIQEALNSVYGENAQDVPITLKIETLNGFNNLPDILAAAASKNPTSVMIARGDLAVEAGFSELGYMQELILSFCQAAHIPVIWATQVLETLTDTGTPTRSEISDVAMGARADAIMLNKGKYIVETIETLNALITDRHRHYHRNLEVLTSLNIAKKVDTD